jgi:hypothetical protein
VIYIKIIGRHKFNNDKSQFEVRHCQGFSSHPAHCLRSQKFLQALRTVPTNNARTGDHTQRSWNLLQFIKMSYSPKPSEIDLYDMDHFDPSLSDRDLPHLRGRSMEKIQQALNSNTPQTSSNSIDLYDQDRYSIPDEELSSVGSHTDLSEDVSTTASMETEANTSQVSSGRQRMGAKKHRVTRTLWRYPWSTAWSGLQWRI